MTIPTYSVTKQMPNHADKRLPDNAVISAAEGVLAGTSPKGKLSRVLPFMGPAFIASVAYIDPGNFATNIASGARFGYLLLWAIVASNCMAMVIQALSAKLGIATGLNLAEHCREQFPRPIALFLWIVMEVVVMATDLAEFIGAAIGFNLLFGMPLLAAGFLTAVVTFLVLGLERFGFRPLEVVITTMVGVVAACYLFETFLGRPDWGKVIHSVAVPRLAGSESVLLTAGIVGATIMPHAIFLHSALTQGRIVIRDRGRMRQLFRYELLDVFIAMGLASLINAAMLIMAAATFHTSGATGVATIQEAYRTLQPLLGPAAGGVFAVSLLASGLSSSSVGTMAGQVIMQGFVRWHIPIWLRRLVTMLPSLGVIALGLEPTRTLVISQVVLSFGLPFAVIPLVMFTSRRSIMGDLTNRSLTTAVSIVIAGLILSLNAYLLYQLTTGG